MCTYIPCLAMGKRQELDTIGRQTWVLTSTCGSAGRIWMNGPVLLWSLLYVANSFFLFCLVTTDYFLTNLYVGHSYFCRRRKKRLLQGASDDVRAERELVNKTIPFIPLFSPDVRVLHIAHVYRHPPRSMIPSCRSILALVFISVCLSFLCVCVRLSAC